MPYLESILGVYKHVIQKSTIYSSNAASKVKQEILHGLGNAVLHPEILLLDPGCVRAYINLIISVLSYICLRLTFVMPF